MSLFNNPSITRSWTSKDNKLKAVAYCRLGLRDRQGQHRLHHLQTKCQSRTSTEFWNHWRKLKWAITSISWYRSVIYFYVYFISLSHLLKCSSSSVYLLPKHKTTCFFLRIRYKSTWWSTADPVTWCRLLTTIAFTWTVCSMDTSIGCSLSFLVWTKDTFAVEPISSVWAINQKQRWRDMKWVSTPLRIFEQHTYDM